MLRPKIELRHFSASAFCADGKLRQVASTQPSLLPKYNGAAGSSIAEASIEAIASEVSMRN